jgi:hypothetical protein
MDCTTVSTGQSWRVRRNVGVRSVAIAVAGCVLDRAPVREVPVDPARARAQEAAVDRAAAAVAAAADATNAETRVLRLYDPACSAWRSEPKRLRYCAGLRFTLRRNSRLKNPASS